MGMQSRDRRGWTQSGTPGSGVNWRSSSAVSPADVAGYIGDHQYTLMRVYSHWLRDNVDVPTNTLNRAYDTNVVPLRRKPAETPGVSPQRRVHGCLTRPSPGAQPQRSRPAQRGRSRLTSADPLIL